MMRPCKRLPFFSSSSSSIFCRNYSIQCKFKLVKRVKFIRLDEKKSIKRLFVSKSKRRNNGGRNNNKKYSSLPPDEDEPRWDGGEKNCKLYEQNSINSSSPHHGPCRALPFHFVLVSDLLPNGCKLIRLIRMKNEKRVIQLNANQ